MVHMLVKNNEKGFTLVELMISLVLSLLITAAMYATYTLQRKSAASQGRVMEMQQNLRAGLMMMSKEIKMAGYDPDKIAKDKTCDVDGDGKSVAPGIHTATATALGFSMDLNRDGDCAGTGENVTYQTYTAVDGIRKLSRKSPNINSAVAENIENIEFFYTLSDGTQTAAPSAAKLSDIHMVTISILARSAERDPQYINNTTYTTASGAKWVVNDGLKRRFVVTNVNCRNMVL